jgi:hypothetical protein
LARWRGRRAREMRTSVHPSDSSPKAWREKEPRTRRSFLIVATDA